jgi:hypothetical protein
MGEEKTQGFGFRFGLGIGVLNWLRYAEFCYAGSLDAFGLATFCF